MKQKSNHVVNAMENMEEHVANKEYPQDKYNNEHFEHCTTTKNR